MGAIVLASGNQNKLREFREVLPDWEIVTAKDLGFSAEVEETGASFEENALIKAQAVQDFLKSQGKNYIVVAEDSGLCVNALGGAPGILSARYAGEHGDDQANRDKLRRELKAKEGKSAFYNCTIVVLHPEGEKKVFVGKTRGKIIDEEKGENGFAYDVLFWSDDLGKTFGEASAEEKNRVSHRGRAIQEMKKYLKFVEDVV